MIRYALPVSLLLLAACSGGKDDESGPEATADIGPLQKVEPPAPAEQAEAVADAGTADAADEAPPKTDAGSGDDSKGIPAAIRGRWALKAADCRARKGTDLTALTIDASNLGFFESHGELARVRERSESRILADYKFSGEGMDWDRTMQLSVQDGGKTLVRRDMGEGAAAEPIRYIRCAG